MPRNTTPPLAAGPRPGVSALRGWTMTEHEWLTTANAEMLIRFVAPGASDRKLHYYAIACARRIKQLLPDPASLAGIDVLERYVEDEQSAEDVGRINWDVEGAAVRFDY